MGSTGDPVPVAIALGSNLGDREHHLRQALEALAPVIHALAVSSFHDTEPIGVSPQPRFLNAAATGLTTLSAAELLTSLLNVETSLGRVRPFPGAARTLDLDLILYGHSIIDTPGLAVPHPRFREREFVLAPLAEVAADFVDPVTGQSIAQLLQTLRRGA